MLDAVAENKDDLAAALKAIVSADVRVVEDGADIVGLNLDDTKITDAGLEKLTGLKKLRWIGLARTGISPEGAAKLRGALPDCHVLA